jgi:type I restriction enzyme, S subunit
MSEGLKKGWTKVAFGDVVRQVKDKVEPELSGLERYVAGEHMDTDDLKIRRWGTIGDGYLGPAFHMRFKPGHVLYGSRRTYLRKVAVPDFEGITANTTYVINTKDPKVLMQELLPFIMQTESFHEHSIKQSKGSVNPYINFSDLTWYEFALPPLEEQELIANLLNKINKCAQSHQELSVGIELILNTYICKSIIGEQEGDLVYDDRFGYHAKHFKLNAIGELIEKAQYGLSLPSVNNGNYPMIRMMDLSGGYVSGDNLCSVNISENDFINYRLDKGDILFNRTNSHKLVGRTGIYCLEGEHVFASYLIRLKTATDKLLPEYLTIFLNSLIGRKQVMKYASKGVSQTNINASNLKNTLMPLPNIKYQEEVINHVQSIRSILMRTQNRIDELNKMMQVLANNLLEVVE